MIAMKEAKPIPITRASGYVGGRLIPSLLDAWYQVLAMGMGALLYIHK